MEIRNIRDDKVLITSDTLFAYLMQDEEVCKGIVERILGRKIKKISYPEGHKEIRELLSDKSVILDVYFTDEEGVKYNVEMQRANVGNIPKRSRYYHSKIDSLKTKVGTPYNKLEKSYVIFICGFDLFKKDKPLYTFRKTCLEEPELILQDDQITIFVNLTSMELDSVDISLKNMILYMREETVRDDFTRLLDSKVEEANIKDKAEGGDLMTLEEKINEELNQREEETRTKTREEVKAEEYMHYLKKHVELIKKGLLSKEVAIEELGYTEEEINKFL